MTWHNPDPEATIRGATQAYTDDMRRISHLVAQALTAERSVLEVLREIDEIAEIYK